MTLRFPPMISKSLIPTRVMPYLIRHLRLRWAVGVVWGGGPYWGHPQQGRQGQAASGDRAASTPTVATHTGSSSSKARWLRLAHAVAGEFKPISRFDHLEVADLDDLQVSGIEQAGPLGGREPVALGGQGDLASIGKEHPVAL